MGFALGGLLAGFGAGLGKGMDTMKEFAINDIKEKREAARDTARMAHEDTMQTRTIAAQGEQTDKTIAANARNTFANTASAQAIAAMSDRSREATERARNEMQAGLNAAQIKRFDAETAKLNKETAGDLTTDRLFAGAVQLQKQYSENARYELGKLESQQQALAAKLVKTPEDNARLKELDTRALELRGIQDRDVTYYIGDVSKAYVVAKEKLDKSGDKAPAPGLGAAVKLADTEDSMVGESTTAALPSAPPADAKETSPGVWTSPSWPGKQWKKN